MHSSITYFHSGHSKSWENHLLKELADDCLHTASWEPQEQGVKQQAASFPSVETEVIEPEGGRKHHTGVASNAETCTTQTQDFAPTNSEIVNLTGCCNKGLNVWCGR